MTMDALVPFVVTTRSNHPFLRLNGEPLGADIVVMDIENPQHRPFVCALNDTNQKAFGGANMGMPRWVMLDCGILPSAIVGFALPTAQASETLLETLGIDGSSYDYPYVPITEYCASPMVEPGCVSGFSLQSQVTGQGLATRTKALALWVYKATAQVGVTQYDNAAIRVHTRFGALKLMIHRPSIHTHADKSFVYRVDLPDASTLVEMAAGTRAHVELDTQLKTRWQFRLNDPIHHEKLDALLARGVTPLIVPPGWHSDSTGPLLDLYWEE